MEYRTDRNTRIERDKDRNAQILARKVALYNERPGPRAGDFLKKADGTYTRFTYNWGEDSNCMQAGGSENSHGYYLSEGYCTYSGGLNPGVKLTDLLSTEETKKGVIWFFSNDYVTAHNGVHFEIDCRVFVLKEGADTSGLW